MVIVEREVTLPEDGGRTNFSFRVTGLVAFLVAKTAALVGRDKPKDAYDIVWIIENWDGGPVGAASAVRASAVLGREDVRAALSLLSEKFSRPDELGPSTYSRFMAEPGAGIDERRALVQGRGRRGAGVLPSVARPVWLTANADDQSRRAPAQFKRLLLSLDLAMNPLTAGRSKQRIQRRDQDEGGVTRCIPTRLPHPGQDLV